ncbi:hypothetical protein YB2330_002146 [Saitoella coloradoensis]
MTDCEQTTSLSPKLSAEQVAGLETWWKRGWHYAGVSSCVTMANDLTMRVTNELELPLQAASDYLCEYQSRLRKEDPEKHHAYLNYVVWRWMYTCPVNYFDKSTWADYDDFPGYERKAHSPPKRTHAETNHGEGKHSSTNKIRRSASVSKTSPKKVKFTLPSPPASTASSSSQSVDSTAPVLQEWEALFDDTFLTAPIGTVTLPRANALISSAVNEAREGGYNRGRRASVATMQFDMDDTRKERMVGDVREVAGGGPSLAAQYGGYSPLR